MSELESVFVQTQNEWKEALYQWNGANQELALEKELLRELSIFAETYKESSDFAEVRQRIADVWIKKNGEIESELSVNDTESQNTKKRVGRSKGRSGRMGRIRKNHSRNVQRQSYVTARDWMLLEFHIEFYKVIEFGDNLEEEACKPFGRSFIKDGNSGCTGNR